MHVIRVVPVVERARCSADAMKAGDLYTAAGALPVNDQPRVTTTAPVGCSPGWPRPSGVAVSPSGALFYADAGLGTVRVIGTGAGAP